MPRRTILDTIRRLDPEKDFRQIALLDTCHEFPWDTTRALEFALFRSFAVPSIGRLLAQTGEFTRRSQKRNDDTELVMAEILEHGFDSPRGRAAFRVMNRLHGRYRIANEDFLYILSTFVLEPIRWNARFGWRPMIAQEKLAAYYYWRTMAHYMNIKDVPASYVALDRFNREYEQSHFAYTSEGRSVAVATRDMFLGWFLPGPLRRLGEPGFHAMLDEPLLEAFRLPRPSPLMRWLVEGGLRVRARAIRRLLPERRGPLLRTRSPIRSYPRGYQIEDLGPPVE